METDDKKISKNSMPFLYRLLSSFLQILINATENPGGKKCEGTFEMEDEDKKNTIFQLEGMQYPPEPNVQVKKKLFNQGKCCICYST